MFTENSLDKIRKALKSWEEGPLKKSLDRFRLSQNPNRFYTPLDVKDFDFLDKVGFPGQYPFTAGSYPTHVPGSEPVKGGGSIPSGGGLVRIGRYSGYGTAEDTRDNFKYMISMGRTSGPNLAFDLPTQCGLDPDHPMAKGEVGRTGVAISSFKDFETVYEAFVGEYDLDKIASAYTINPMADIMLAMYIALAQKRGIPEEKLRCTPQNDILKEFVARGTQVFPLEPSMRMVRDAIVYTTNHMPLAHPVSITGFHFREAGASRVQVLALTLADLIAYVQLGIDAGLDIDTFAPRLSILDYGGSLEVFKEVALRRASRRMEAKIMKERFKAKNPRSWQLPELGGMPVMHTCTEQRPLNNIVRAALGGIAAALSGDIPRAEPPYDEPLGLGWSMEAMQLSEDTARILQYEAHLSDVIDPLAGSYYVENLTDQIENEAWAIIDKIDSMGGMVAAIESGWVQREVAQSAYQYQHEVETGERVIVGVNKFTGDNEIEVTTTRSIVHPYDPARRSEAEKKQLAKIKQVRRERDNRAVQVSLKRLKEAAQDEKVNLIPVLVETVKTYATIGEMTETLKQVFDVYQPEPL